MTESHESEIGEHWAIAALCISWALEDKAAFTPGLRAKLSVPSGKLISALASLAPEDARELKSGISGLAASCSLPGPMKPKELHAFLDSLSAASQFRPRRGGLQQQRPPTRRQKPGPGMNGEKEEVV
jgi:hypothetical protein